MATDVNAIWDEAHLKALLQLSHSPLHLIQAPPWDEWIQQHGGLKAVQRYLLNLEELAEDQRHLLRVILEHPQQTAEWYAASSHISRKTYFRVMGKLLPVLERSLNGWSPSSSLIPSGPPVFHLPVPLTHFVGREKEIAEAKQLLSKARLVTLTGTGGIGKTRLSLQVATALQEFFNDRVWFVELAPLSDPGLVPQTVATALGVREVAGRPIWETLTGYLRARKDSLLLLDNCEHLVEACAELAGSLLQACPRLRLLASSREALGITGEILFRVPSLSLPDLEKLLSFEGLTRSEAAQLFVERAREALPGFTLTHRNALAVAQICYRLEGLPLAIELAAARVNVLTVEQIAARLDDRLHLLSGGSRLAPRRQQTLQAAIDWSYDLLSQPECVLLQRLSVFVGGWTLEAVEQLAGDWKPGASERPLAPRLQSLAPEAALDLLTQLVNKSLVGVEKEQRPEARYRLLETIRQYAQEKLVEAGEAEKIRDQHLALFLKLAQETEPKLFGAEQRASLERLEMERDNLRAALEWALENETTRIEDGLRLAGALYWFWHLAVHFKEGIEWLKQLLAAGNPQTVPAAVRAKALTGLAWLMGVELGRTGTPQDAEQALSLSQESLTLYKQLDDQQGMAFALRSQCQVYLSLQPRDYERCESAARESLALFSALGHTFGRAEMITMLGYIARGQGDLERAEAFFEEALSLRRAVGSLDGIAWGLAQLGRVAVARSNYPQAKTALHESLLLWRELGVKEWIAQTTSSLADILVFEGDYQHAAELAQESLAAFRETGNKRYIAGALFFSGDLALGLGEADQARRWMEEGLGLFRELENKLNMAWALSHLGRAVFAQKNVEQATNLYQESLKLYQEWATVSPDASHLGMVFCLIGLAGVARVHQQAVRAASWLGVAGTFLETLAVKQGPIWPPDRTYYDETVTAVRAEMDEATFSAAWAEGRAMTLEQVVAYALDAGAEPLKH